MPTRKRINNALLLTLIVALLLSGCSAKKPPTSSIPETYVGIQGVDAAFAPESVPNVATAGSSSNSLLLIANNGAVDADLAGLIVTVRDTKGAFKFEKPVIKGAEIQSLLSEPSKTSGKLAGKASNAAGSVDSIKLKVNVVADGRDTIGTGFLATVCYQYTTKLTANVCVDASGYSFQKVRKPCDPKVALTFASQGAPVAIKKIETTTENSGGAVMPKFKIYIGNVGNGLIIDRDSIGMFCTDQKKTGDNKKINVVFVDSVELNGNRLDCNDIKDGRKMPMVLTGNAAKDFVLCSYRNNDFKEGSGTFATPIKIHLSYGYTATSAQVPVTVEKSGSFETATQGQAQTAASAPVAGSQDAGPSTPEAPTTAQATAEPTPPSGFGHEITG